MTDSFRDRVHDLFAGTGFYPVFAALFLLAGLLLIGVEAQSSTALQWTGKKTAATLEGGIAFYTVDGVEYSVDAPHEPPGPFGVKKPTTVYYDPNDPTRAMQEGPEKWIEGGFIAAVILMSPLLLALGFVRRARRRRRRAAHDAWLSGAAAR